MGLLGVCQPFSHLTVTARELPTAISARLCRLPYVLRGALRSAAKICNFIPQWEYWVFYNPSVIFLRKCQLRESPMAISARLCRLPSAQGSLIGFREQFLNTAKKLNKATDLHFPKRLYPKPPLCKGRWLAKQDGRVVSTA